MRHIGITLSVLALLWTVPGCGGDSDDKESTTSGTAGGATTGEDNQCDDSCGFINTCAGNNSDSREAAQCIEDCNADPAMAKAIADCVESSVDCNSYKDCISGSVDGGTTDEGTTDGECTREDGSTADVGATRCDPDPDVTGVLTCIESGNWDRTTCEICKVVPDGTAKCFNTDTVFCESHCDCPKENGADYCTSDKVCAISYGVLFEMEGFKASGPEICDCDALVSNTLGAIEDYDGKVFELVTEMTTKQANNYAAYCTDGLVDYGGVDSNLICSPQYVTFKSEEGLNLQMHWCSDPTCSDPQSAQDNYYFDGTTLDRVWGVTSVIIPPSGGDDKCDVISVSSGHLRKTDKGFTITEIEKDALDGAELELSAEECDDSDPTAAVFDVLSCRQARIYEFELVN
ncbi:MAG TPA: hypothetical protein EYN66_09320 [Myxococcales bacterium]|nr:hypothetical protein [Myxococcales bacterium]